MQYKESSKEHNITCNLFLPQLLIELIIKTKIFVLHVELFHSENTNYLIS